MSSFVASHLRVAGFFYAPAEGLCVPTALARHLHLIKSACANESATVSAPRPSDRNFKRCADTINRPKAPSQPVEPRRDADCRRRMGEGIPGIRSCLPGHRSSRTCKPQRSGPSLCCWSRLGASRFAKSENRANPTTPRMTGMAPAPGKMLASPADTTPDVVLLHASPPFALTGAALKCGFTSARLKRCAIGRRHGLRFLTGLRPPSFALAASGLQALGQGLGDLDQDDIGGLAGGELCLCPLEG